MTLDLPVRAAEAAELARLTLELAGARPLADDVRQRLAARAARLGLETIRPWFGSLARDPVHRASCYLAVDGAGGEPLLLHFTPHTAPTSSVFRAPLLICRAAGVVVNAVPFGPGNRANLEAFAARIAPDFQPRAQGPRSAIVVGCTPAAFDAFRAILKRTGKNLATVAGPYHDAVWSAVRAGWRDGWSAAVDLDMAAARETVRECPLYTRFAVPVDDLEAAAQLHEFIRRTRAAAKVAGAFDFELSLERASAPTTPAELERALDFLAASGHAAQFIAPRIARAEDIPALAEAALRRRAALSVRAPWPPAPARLSYRAGADTENLEAIASVLA